MSLYIEKLVNRFIKKFQVQFNLIVLTLISVLKQQQFGQRKEEQQKIKMQINTRKHSIESLQTTAVLGTSYIIRKIMQIGTCSERWG